MSTGLERWNLLPPSEAAKEILPCCGSHEWATRLAGCRPIPDADALLETSDRVWGHLSEDDWQEAFDSHPRIGEKAVRVAATCGQSAAWSVQEQQQAAEGDGATQSALADGNRAYEEKFGRIFIICATGKPASEILANLSRRLENDKPTELQEAVEQQRQITRIRLHKWLNR